MKMPIYKIIIYKLFACTLFFISSSVLVAQTSDVITTADATESLRHAQKLINQGEVEKAIKQLDHTIKIKNDFAVAWRVKGKLFYDLGYYKDAAELLETSFELDQKISRAAFFECGDSYLKLYDMELAHYYFTRFSEMENEKYVNSGKEASMEIDYKSRLSEKFENIKFIESLGDLSTYNKVEPVSKQVNSIHDEYLPAISSAGDKFIFTRKKKYQDENIFSADINDGKFNHVSPMGKINSPLNEGMAKISPRSDEIFCAICKRQDSYGGCDIYTAKIEDGKIETFENAEGKLNSRSWDSQPTISCDGQYLYFASTREGGYGGADIWVSQMDKNGEWGVPENMGAHINTPGDEEAPYIAVDGNTLFFTSNGHPGQGDGDIFYTKNYLGIWTLPKNLGYPINSPAKELGIFIDPDNKTAYVSSARLEGEGGMDIYKAELPYAAQPDKIGFLEVTVQDKYSTLPIPTIVRVAVKGNDPMMIWPDETGKFFMCVPSSKAISFQVEEEGFEYYINAHFTSSNPGTTEQFVIDLVPIGKAQFASKGANEVVEKRIQFFFEHDSDELTEKTVNDLKDLSGLLAIEKDWNIEIVGYADSKGSLDYNVKLSEKRAGVIANYLKQSGVSSGKIIRHEGKGSINHGKSEIEQKQSRRVDIILRK